jgi:uncharacterized CHY-type Zn-finger protein
VKETIDVLKNTDVISNENVYSLKRYIVKKYPDCGYKRQTEIFADSVHRILNRNLKPFKEAERDNIKAKVLINAVNKKEFSINAYEIFRQCMIVNNGEKEYCRNMEDWLNSQKNINVDSFTFNTFIEKVWQEQGNNVDETINNAASAIDSDIKNADMADDSLHSSLNAVNKLGSEKFINASSDGEVLTDGVQEGVYKKEISLVQIFVYGCSLFTLKVKYFIKNVIKSFLLEGKYRRRIAIYSFAAFILVFLGTYGIKLIYESHQKTVPADNEVISNGDMGIIDGLSDEFKYTVIDKESLRRWLSSKNSILSDDRYLNPIIEASKEYNVNSLLLIAIAGQEQAFVPRDVKNAEKIANNPFNVFGSWQAYNTNISDSARIAAETIVYSSNGRPVNEDELRWINKRYAQDPNWWLGVTKIFYQIKKDILAKSE